MNFCVWCVLYVELSITLVKVSKCCIMSSVIDIRVRNTQKKQKVFNYSAIPFPDIIDIISDKTAEQMMMDGSVTYDASHAHQNLPNLISESLLC